MENGNWFCPKCGVKNSDRFCIKCGFDKSNITPSVQTQDYLSKEDFLNKVEPDKIAEADIKFQPEKEETSPLPSQQKNINPPPNEPKEKRKRGYKWNWIDNILFCGIILTTAAILFIWFILPDLKDDDNKIAETTEVLTSEVTSAPPETTISSEITTTEEVTTELTTDPETTEQTTTIPETVTETTTEEEEETSNSGSITESTATTAAGVSNFRGEWKVSEEYRVGEIVTHKGIAYRAIVENYAFPGTEPPNWMQWWEIA